MNLRKAGISDIIEQEAGAELMIYDLPDKQNHLAFAKLINIHLTRIAGR